MNDINCLNVVSVKLPTYFDDIKILTKRHSETEQPFNIWSQKMIENVTACFIMQMISKFFELDNFIGQFKVDGSRKTT